MTRLSRLVSPTAVRGPLRTAVLVLGVESALALAYLGLTGAGLAAPTTLAVPFVWITVAVVAVRHADRPEAGRVAWTPAAGVGVAYTLFLGWITGTVGPAVGSATGLEVVLLPPGWGPVLRYSGAELSVFLFPYRAIGYVALGYLVALGVHDAIDRGASVGLGGMLALGSCASCALPVLAVVAGVFGGAGLGVLTGGTYFVGTAAYVLSVAVLAVRPTVRK